MVILAVVESNLKKYTTSSIGSGIVLSDNNSLIFNVFNWIFSALI